LGDRKGIQLVNNLPSAIVEGSSYKFQKNKTVEQKKTKAAAAKLNLLIQAVQ